MSNGDQGPLVTQPLFSPPAAVLSLNAPDILIRQAQDYELFAATESCLSENGAREKFWRAAAAMRLAARFASCPQFSDLFREMCLAIDLQRRAQT